MVYAQVYAVYTQCNRLCDTRKLLQQIVTDISQDSCIRLTDKDRDSLMQVFGKLQLIPYFYQGWREGQGIEWTMLVIIFCVSSMISEKHGLGAEYMEASTAVKQEVIEMAKQMSCYFTQIYEVKVTVTLCRICPAMYLICSARHLRLMILVLLPS